MVGRTLDDRLATNLEVRGHGLATLLHCLYEVQDLLLAGLIGVSTTLLLDARRWVHGAAAHTPPSRHTHRRRQQPLPSNGCVSLQAGCKVRGK